MVARRISELANQRISDWFVHGEGREESMANGGLGNIRGCISWRLNRLYGGANLVLHEFIRHTLTIKSFCLSNSDPHFEGMPRKVL